MSKNFLTKNLKVVLLTTLLSCGNKKNDLDKIPVIKRDSFATKQSKSVSQLFELTKQKYDTLISIFDGLFITFSNNDTSNFHLLRQSKNKEYIVSADFNPMHKKWGVIDSLGHTIVPFVCDAVKSLNEHTGVISLGRGNQYRIGGIDRYYYYGNCFFFSKDSIQKDESTKFTMEFIINHNDELKAYDMENLISLGTDFYLPTKYRNPSKNHY
ncbi:MAG: hypothetical protein SFY56_08770 [Bacteroidota bacterium]|nr:hypothetical protein [Bacteroidota bacterium]